MKFPLLIITSLFVLLGCSSSHPVPKDKPTELAGKKPVMEVNKVQNNPNLIWQDEFKKKKINTKLWNVVEESAWKPVGRLAAYRPENVVVTDGKMKIDVRKKKYKSDPYTSGAINTLGKKDILYGRLEVRAKLPDGKGVFPAIWLLPVDGTEFPEIDIAELLGQENKTLWNVVHWKEKGKKKRDFSSTIFKKPLTDDYHVYGLNWTKKKLTFTVDGKVTFETTKQVPKKRMYLYINVAVGGQWATNPSPKQKFPKEMSIDYVRYYKN